MTGKKRIWPVLVAVAVAGALTLLAGLGALKTADLSACDALYQSQGLGSDEIVIVGIDQDSMDLLGPFPWGRDVIAMLLEALNADEEERPAVIAIDVLFAGESDPDADAYLAEAAGAYGNVITACAGVYGDALLDNGAGDYELAPASVVYFEGPYDALSAVTEQGHINAMLDDDGVLRHHMLTLTLQDGTEYPSLALAAARQYRAASGGELSLLPPTNSRGFWYLPFAGVPDGTFQYVSAVDLLTSDGLTGLFGGKIVLIGPCAAGLQDSYFTAIDHAQLMYGVEIQANATQALLNGNYKQEVRKGPQLAALFLLLLVAFAAFWRRKVRTATVLLLALCGGWVLLCRSAYEAGWVLHVLWVPVGVALLYVGCLAANYIQAALERQKVTRTFRRYVAPEIVSELMNAGPAALELGGKKCEIAVLFVDIRGFTTMSESLAPERVVEILNQYLTLTTKCVMDNHGTLDKFVGDCTMAFWNAPLPQEDYVMLACRAAMAMAEGAKPLAEMLERQYGHTVSFGIGVHAGPAVIGNIGAPMRMDYTAIGDTVNTAARLEANAPAGTIFISRTVADALAGRIKAAPLENPPQLKGKAADFEILTLDKILPEEETAP